MAYVEPPRDVSDYSPQAHGARCDLCPLAGENYVPFEAPKNGGKPRLILVGEGPGYKESIRRRPFVGVSGAMVDDVLDEVGESRWDTFVTNSALCRGDTDKDNDRAAECCAPRLLKELVALPADIPIVALGKSATRSILGVKSILLARGFVWTARELDKPIKAAEAAARKARKSAGPHPDKFDKMKIQAADLRVEVLRARHALAGRIVLPTVHPAFVLRADVWSPILRLDMNRAARVARGELRRENLQDNITKIARARDLVPRTYIVTDDPKEIARAAARLGPVVSVDIETESAKPLSPLLVKILCVQVSDGDRTFVIGPWAPALHARPLSEALRDRTVVAHNGFNFDWVALERDGVVVDPTKIEDTLIAHHAFASHFPQRLDHVVSTFLDSSPWKVKHGRRGAEEKGLATQDMDPDELYFYGAQDAVLTVKAWHAMQADLADELSVYAHDKELSLQAKGLQVGGFKVDRKRKYLLARLLKARAAALKGRLRHICKRPDFEPSRLGEVRRVLFTTLRAPMLNPTATGLASTSNATLETLKAGTNRAAKFAAALLDWRIAQKIRSTYVVAVVVHPDGRSHYTWRNYGTVSGRYACRLQSAPRWSTAVEDRVREMYTADPGCDLWYFDLSQAEARFAANLSGDKNFIDTCKGDVHSGNALILFPDASERILRDAKGKNCPKHAGGSGICNCGKPFRDIAKNAGFAVAYLAEAPTVFAYLRAHGFNVELDAVIAMLDRLKAAYRTYYSYVADNVAFVQKHGYLRTPIVGRIRWLGCSPPPTEVANCLDEETEALTQRGWVRGFDLKVGDKLLTKSITSGEMTWQPIRRMQLYPKYKGRLFEFRSKSFNAVTTPEHRWLVRDRRAGIDRVATSEELAQGTGELSIHRTGTYVAAPARIYADDLIELAGWLLTDGSIGARRIAIYQTKRRNVRAIDALFRRLGAKINRRSGVGGRVTWYVQRSSPIAAAMWRLFPERTLSQEFLRELTAEQLRLLLDTMIRGDGSVEKGKHARKRFCCRDKARADALQTLALMCGIATTARWRGPSRPKRQYKTMANRPMSKGIWIVSLLARGTAQVLRHPRRYGKVTKCVDQVREYTAASPVWCPVVPNTYFVARRRGDVFITSNSPIQSGIADVMNTRTIVMQRRLPEGARLVAQVHDACLFSVPKRHTEWELKKKGDKVERIPHGAMADLIEETWAEPVRLQASIVCRQDREFMLPAEIKVGRRWSDFG